MPWENVVTKAWWGQTQQRYHTQTVLEVYCHTLSSSCLWGPAKDLKHRSQVHKPEIGVHSKQPSQSDELCFYWWWWDTKKQQISSSTAKSNLLTVIVRETAKLFSNPWPCHSIQSQQQAITRLWIPQDRPLNSPKGKDIEFRSGHSTDAWSSSVNGKWVLLDPLWNSEIMYSISAQIKTGFCKQLR